MSVRQRLPRARWVLLVACALLLAAAGVGSFAAFTATSQNANTLQSAPDWTAPTVGSQVLAASTSGIANHVKPGEAYNVYANVTDAGNPAAGVASATVDASGVSTGQGAAALSSGSFSFGGTAYSRRTGALTADASLPACRYSYPITATDAASPANSATQTGQKAMVDRDLTSDYNIRIDGESTGGRAGYSVAGAGDVNGDGRPDALVGALEAGRDTRTTAGSVYVVFGQSSPTNLDLGALGTQGYRIDGLGSGYLTGASIANAGDVNADGKPDALIGAYGGNDAYVIFGKSTTTNVDLNAIGTQGYRIDGPASTNFGISVANAGDVNGDGKPDAILGASGADNNARTDSGSAYIVFGKATTTAIDVAALGTGGYRIDGAAAGEQLGRGVAGTGDINADGRADVVVGSYLADANARTDSGSAYVVFGKSVDQNPIDLAALGTGGYRIDGAAANTNTGFRVAGAGDVNGDGKPDTLVGAYQADNNARSNSGSAYIVFGKSADTTTIDLNALGTGGYRIDGAVASDQAGVWVENAGDVNGDGKPDALIGAFGADYNSRGTSGSGYVVFGKATTTNIDLAALGAQGYRIDGAAANDQAGWSMAAAGDVNADSRADVLVGALFADHTSREAVGAGYVVYGKSADTNAIDLNALGTGGYRMSGEGTSTQATWSLAGAGDVNNDGREDVVIGAYNRDRDSSIDAGAAYVVFGQASPTNVNLASLGSLGYRIDGALAGDTAGYRVADAGDVNGDGNDDTLVGAYQADFNSRGNSGSAYIVFGKATTTTVDLNALGTGGYRIDGAAASDNAGISVANAGDVNADGKPDALVGAYVADNNARTNSGSAYVVFGKATTTNIDLNALGAQGYRIDGAAANDNAGRLVANAGDVNGDGKPDALIGAPAADNNARTDSGSAYIVFGKATDTNAINLAALGTAGYRVDGVAASDNAGWSVAGAGDVNGDGRADTIVGASAADHNARSNSGTAYVVFGKAADQNPIDLAALGSGGYRIDGATVNDAAAYFVANAGDVNADGIPDALVGAYAFNKPSASDSGAAYVVFGKSSTANIDLASPGLAAYRIDGAATNDQAGLALAGAGDLNGDGRPDFLIGARYADTAGADAGSAYLRYSPSCSNYSSSVFGTTGLVGYWRLGELSGTTALDAQASNNLTHTGGSTVGVTGALNSDNDKAASFDGVDDYVQRADTAVLEPRLGSFSWEMWFQTTSTARVGLYRHSDGANAKGVLLDVNGGAVGQVRAQVETIAVSTPAGTPYNDGAWHHVAAVLDRGANQLRLYLDGSLAATSSVSAISAVDLDSTGTVLVGSVASPFFFNGKLDEVALYNTALSAARIKEHYDAR